MQLYPDALLNFRANIVMKDHCSHFSYSLAFIYLFFLKRYKHILLFSGFHSVLELVVTELSLKRFCWGHRIIRRENKRLKVFQGYQIVCIHFCLCVKCVRLRKSTLCKLDFGWIFC